MKPRLKLAFPTWAPWVSVSAGVQAAMKWFHRFFDFLPEPNRSLGAWLSQTQTLGSFQSLYSPYSCKQRWTSEIVLLYTQGRSTSAMQFSINCWLALSLLFEDRSLSTGVCVTGALSQREWWYSLCAQWALTCRWWWRTWWGAMGVEQCWSDPALTYGGHCATAGCWGIPTPPWGGGGHRRSIPPACKQKVGLLFVYILFVLFCFNFSLLLNKLFCFHFCLFFVCVLLPFCLLFLCVFCFPFCLFFVLFWYILFWWSTDK